ncbi:MAG: hypothetical protein AVO38_12780 [delta proteobacterium ML8_D]|nr:MAG: hypothetical protein AVO38_12780 [delta proteobacterium ML8_D]
MCGICGILSLQTVKQVDRHALEKMTDIMFHRGPDDEGMLLSDNCGLGFRRLSIIDLALGHQPMSNEHGDVWIVFNGEIYNHQDLRKDLEAKGHIYKTRTDTETIIHLYEEEGIDGFKKMNGMFAFAIFDGPRKRLVLARDRMGIKPLHYTVTNNNLIFASEIKSILEHPNVKAGLNEQALEELLTFRYVSGEKTIFKNILNVLPGHFLICENGSINISSFWSLSLPNKFLDIDEKAAVNKLEELLRASVELRLMSDVPLGTFCSGGVDSSLITAYAKLASNSELHTFSVGFHEEDWDETRYAEIVSKSYGTSHHVLRIDGKTYADSLPKLIWYHDIPIYHPCTVLIYHVSRLARKYVAVVLTGEGSDEEFGGYPRFLIPREYARLHKFPKFMRQIFKGLIRQFPNRKLNKFGYFLPCSLEEVVFYNAAYVTPELVNSILSGNGALADLEYRRSVIAEAKINSGNLVEATMFSDLKNYIPSALHPQDKMCMAASIENRVPFMDHNLVEWAIRVPLHLKIRGMKNKYIIKKLGEKMLPHEVIGRQKVGFGVPVAGWLRQKESLGRYLEMFSEPEFQERGYIKVEKVKQLVDEHLSGQFNHCEIIWNLINLELWHRIFIDKSLNPLALSPNHH